MVAGPYLLPVRRSDANCRQFYQRPLRLPQGTDREDRLGPERACAQGWISTESHAKRNHRHRPVRLSDRICAAVLCPDGQLTIVGLLCVLFAFLYTTGPYPLSYNGWGDVLVIVFFGFVPVGGTYYVQALTWTSDTTVASLICGLLIDTLLVVNNYRDREADARSGKADGHRSFWREVRTLSLFDAGGGSKSSVFLVLLRRTLVCRTSSVTLPDSSCPHMETDGADSQW